VKFT